MTKAESPQLKKLKKACKKIEFTANRILIVSSILPDDIIASSILFRGMVKTNRVFHLKFSEPVCAINDLKRRIAGVNFDHLIIVGIDTLDDNLGIEETKPTLFIGTNLQESDCAVGKRGNSPAAAYAFAYEKMEVGKEELELVATGQLLSPVTDEKVTREVCVQAEKEGAISSRRKFLLFGTSFLPVVETLESSIHPYMKNISGNKDMCKSLLNEADIPFSKRGGPIDGFSTEEKQSLTSVLVPKLSPEEIKSVLGQDYEFLREDDDSPVRFLSSVKALIKTAWMIGEPGLIAAICMGDRARMLRKLIDEHLVIARSTIDALKRFDPESIDVIPDELASIRISVGPRITAGLASVLVSDYSIDAPALLIHGDTNTVFAWKNQDCLKVSKYLAEEKLLGSLAGYNSFIIDSFGPDQQQNVKRVAGRLAEK